MNNKQLDPQLLKELSENKNTLDLPRSNKIAVSRGTDILTAIQNQYQLPSQHTALTVIAIFAQQGASSPSCDGNLSFLYVGKTFKLSEIRKIFADNGAKQGIRKFARTYGSEIYQICKALDIPGNMYQKIQRLFPETEISSEYKYWMSDFQAFNEFAPKSARNLIISAFPKERKKKKK